MKANALTTDFDSIEKEYVKDYNVDKLNKNIQSNRLDPRPEYQRDNVEPNGHKKSREIVETMLTGVDIGQFIFEEKKDGKLAAIDGGHRCEAIRDFMNGKFEADGKYYEDFSEEEQKRFEEIYIPVVVYKNLKPGQAATIFRIVNNSTPVSPMEEAMANDTSEVGKLIRSRVRDLKGYHQKPHELFKCDYTQDGKPKPIHLSGQYNPKGKWFELAGVLLEKTIALGDKKRTNRLVVSNPKTLKSLITEDKSIKKADLNKWDENLTHILRIRQELVKLVGSPKHRKSKISPEQYAALVCILTGIMKDDYKFTIPDYKNFTIKFLKAFEDLHSNNFDDDKRLLKGIKKGQKVKMSVGEFIRKDMIKNYSNPEAQFEVYKLFSELMDIESLIIRLDDKRSADDETKMRQWLKQDMKDYCEPNKFLPFKDAEWAHINPYSEGGKTSEENGVMTHKKHNKAMGKMNPTDYKKSLGYS